MASSGLGNLLVKEGFLSEADRRMIAKTCGHNSWAFAKAVLTTGLLDEDELVAFLADKTHFEVAPRDFLDQIDESITDRVDISLFSRLEVLPIFMDKRHIQVAAVDPLDRDTIRQIEFFTDLKVICWLAPISHIYLGIKSFIPSFQPKQTLIGDFLEHHATTIFYGKNHVPTPIPDTSTEDDDVEEIPLDEHMDEDLDRGIDEALENSLPSDMDTFEDDDFSDLSEDVTDLDQDNGLDVKESIEEAEQDTEDDIDLDAVGSEIEDADKALQGMDDESTDDSAVEDLGDLESDLEAADVGDLESDLEAADVGDLESDLEAADVGDLEAIDLGDLADLDVSDDLDIVADENLEATDDLDIVADKNLEAPDNLEATDDLDIVTDENLEDSTQVPEELDVKTEANKPDSNLEKDLADDLAGIDIDDIGSEEVSEESLDSFEQDIETENTNIEDKLDNVDELDIGDFDKEDNPDSSTDDALEELDLGDEPEEKQPKKTKLPNSTNFPKSAEKKASADDLNKLNKLHLKLMISGSQEKSLKLAEKYMSDIYPDAEIVDLNKKESIKSWLKSSGDSFVDLNDELFKKLESMEPLSWLEIGDNVWATSNHGKKSKIAMITQISPDKMPSRSTLQETSTILQSISSQT